MCSCAVLFNAVFECVVCDMLCDVVLKKCCGCGRVCVFSLNVLVRVVSVFCVIAHVLFLCCGLVVVECMQCL